MILALVACKDEKKQPAQAQNKPVVKIGVSLPLTGDMAFMGNIAKEAVLMNFEKWKSQNTKYNSQICEKFTIFLSINNFSKPQNSKSASYLSRYLSHWYSPYLYSGSQ